MPEWPEFAVIGDDVSGRVPVTRITSWRKLPDLLETPFFNRPKTQLIYRGHRRYDWPLTPSLGRLDPRNIITEEVANAQLRLFRRAVRGRIADRTLVEEAEEYELWSVGQHHGLMTPLLDWTYSPYVALFFAFEREDRRGEPDNPYRALFVLNKTHVEADDRCPNVSVLEPRKDDHGRLVNQAGLFTYSAYGNTLENFLIDSLRDEVLGKVSEEDEAQELAKYICKIYIPNEGRAECLRHLRMMNVHHASLFPDLLGAAKYCNILIEQEAIGYREAKIKKKRQTEPPVTETHGERPTPTVEAGQLKSLHDVLAAPAEAASIEPARLALIADELAKELSKQQFVDWHKRDSVKAAMRNAARVILRRLGYPASAREAVLEQVLSAIEAAVEGES
ncbi:MAG: FRG domain-containing protein [Casimicrobiaceae bacterium]|nr:FRG domain-containing protein [Casimicrobiaceae bacterium]